MMIGVSFSNMRMNNHSMKYPGINGIKDDSFSKMHYETGVRSNSLNASINSQISNSPLVKSANQKHSPILKYNSPVFKRNNAPVSISNMNSKNVNYSKIGIDVINSNRVLMNFNKKNYLGMGHLAKRKEDSRKSAVKQNNIIIKEADFSKENAETILHHSATSEVLPITIEDKKSNHLIGSISYLSNNVSKSNINLSVSVNRKWRGKISNDNLKLNLLNKANDTNLDLDNCVNFLREIEEEGVVDSSFIRHLRLFEAYLEVEFRVDSFGCGNNSYFTPGTSKPNLPLSLRRYFAILKEEANCSEYSLNKDYKEFFTFEAINKLYLKSLKLTIILFTVLFVTSTHTILEQTVKLQIKKLMTSLTSPVLNFVEYFIYNQILLNHNEIIAKDLKPEFLEKYSRVYRNYKLNKVGKLSDIVIVLNKSLESVAVSIKQFSTSLFKYSQMKPFHNVIFDLLRDFEKITLGSITSVVLGNILYSHLETHVVKKRRRTVKPDEDLVKEESVVYLPPIDPKFEYTLVLDLDETLVHYFYTQVGGGLFFVRPFTMEFLKGLAEVFEIVIFTAATKEYADDILDKLDPELIHIQHRLYRNHTSSHGLHIIKDLSRLGRDLSKVIIVDNIPENFKLQMNNGFMIKTWNDNISDTQLQELFKILKDMYLLKVSDVRVAIKRIKDEFSNSKSYAGIEASLYI